jgi:ATP phosphoribosyltransferase
VTSDKVSQTLGVPNRGRLRSYTVSLLRDIGQIDRDRSLVWDQGDTLRIISAHSRDLPSLFLSGVCDYILTGLDYAIEAGISSPPIACLPACRGRVVALTSGIGSIPQTPAIVSQYPNIASRWAFARGLDAVTRVVSGAAELYPRLGLADIAVDVVSSGATCRDNNLLEIDVILHTSCALFGPPLDISAGPTPDWLSVLLQARIHDFQPDIPYDSNVQ